MLKFAVWEGATWMWITVPHAGYHYFEIWGQLEWVASFWSIWLMEVYPECQPSYTGETCG